MKFKQLCGVEEWSQNPQAEEERARNLIHISSNGDYEVISILYAIRINTSVNNNIREVIKSSSNSTCCQVNLENNMDLNFRL